MENIAAADIVLDAELVGYLDSLFHPGSVSGSRYTEEGMIGIEEQ